MSRRVQKAVETNTGKIGIVEPEGGRSKERRGKKMGKKEGKKKQKRGKTVEVKRITEEWEIWDDDEVAAKSKMEVKKLVPEKFYR